MTRRASFPSPILALALACTPNLKPDDSDSPGSGAKPTEPALEPLVEPPIEPEPEALALPPAPTFVAGPFEIRSHDRAPTLPTKLFVNAHPGEDMQDHATTFGWATDGSAFAYCTLVSGEDCELCTFTKLDGSTEALVRGSMCAADGATKVSAKALKQRLVDSGVAMRDGDWAHGGDLLVTTRSVAGPPDNFDPSREILEVGTVRRDGSAAGKAYSEDACFQAEDGPNCFDDAHADAILPSPDGSTIAILAHMWEGEFSDTFTLTLVPAGQLAAASYGARGLDALASGDFEAAANAFVAAMYADPIAWKGPYNLACAYARADDPRVRLALEEAVERGGEPVKTKARKDGDLDSVRAQAWFTTLIGPGK